MCEPTKQKSRPGRDTLVERVRRTDYRVDEPDARDPVIGPRAASSDAASS
ncbi:MAG: hypothetical protein JWO01_2716, partial [Microbacteriaceae bacterium]|nr:hypothetical protein [Microbacteriaceae bacterium]